MSGQASDYLRSQCVYDNRAENQPVFNGEALPVRDVHWGDGTTDEMCAATLFFTRTLEQSPPVPSVYISQPEVWQRFAPGELMPVALRLNNFSLEQPSGHHQEEGDHEELLLGHGHYHVYFDTDDDSAEHVTDWRQQPVVRVPADMKPGVHRLRVSLRSSDHKAIGIEDTVEFRVVDASEAEGGSNSLIDHQRWLSRAERGDPFVDHRPASIECPVSTWGLENGALEVETGVCNYLALHQSSLSEIAKGDRIRLVLWHQQLRNDLPGRAHVALAMDGETLWQQTVAIPNDGGFYDITMTAPADFPAGSELDFHLHNHGFNSWTLLSIERL